MMSTNSSHPDKGPRSSSNAVKPLARALGQSEEIKDLVDEAAVELSAVSAVLRQEVADLGDAPGVESALEKTETVEDKVLIAADKLWEVNQALKEEVHERHVLEFRLAAVTERAEASRNSALHDLLTGLPNRALFNDRLEHGLAQSKRHDRNLAVMFIDLVDFKKVNDTHGHDAGDQVLKAISVRLSASTRDDDTVSRYGGDEFLYLLTEVDSHQALTLVAEKLAASIELPIVVAVADKRIEISLAASIGIALYPDDGTTAQDLVKSADKAMYRAKKGRLRHAFVQ
jgi:diguanylate cyclase